MGRIVVVVVVEAVKCIDFMLHIYCGKNMYVLVHADFKRIQVYNDVTANNSTYSHRRVNST